VPQSSRGILHNNMVRRGNYKAVELARTKDCEIHHNSVYSEDLEFDRVFHAFQGSEGIHVFDNIVRGWGVRADDAGSLVENNLEGELPGIFVDPAGGDLHLGSAGVALALGKGLPLSTALDDFDAESRPPAPAIGADECSPGGN
jgi:hypothetical protein